METSEVQGQFIVYKDPQIVVSVEFELFVSLVSESDVSRKRESEISPLSVEIELTSKTSSIDWKELVGTSCVRRHVLIQQGIARQRVRDLEVHWERDVEIGVVSVPIFESGFVVDFVLRVRGGDRKSVV